VNIDGKLHLAIIKIQVSTDGSMFERNSGKHCVTFADGLQELGYHKRVAHRVVRATD
jgi:hypothetical protein